GHLPSPSRRPHAHRRAAPRARPPPAAAGTTSAAAGSREEWRAQVSGQTWMIPEKLPRSSVAAVSEGLSRLPKALEGCDRRAEFFVAPLAAQTRLRIHAPVLFRPVLIEMGERPGL